MKIQFSSIDMDALPPNPYSGSLVYSWLVCGIGESPTTWLEAQSPSSGRLLRAENSICMAWVPEILDSWPLLDGSRHLSSIQHEAMKV